MATRHRGDPADHQLKPLYLQKDNFAPKLVGYECKIHGELFTKALNLSEPTYTRRKGEDDMIVIKSKAHRDRVEAAGRKVKKKDESAESDPVT